LLCIDAPKLCQRTVAVDKIFPGCKAFLLPEAVADLIAVKYHQRLLWGLGFVGHRLYSEPAGVGGVLAVPLRGTGQGAVRPCTPHPLF